MSKIEYKSCESGCYCAKMTDKLRVGGSYLPDLTLNM